MTDHGNYFGVDRKLVERSMRQARRDRAHALAALVRKIFNRDAVGERSDAGPSPEACCAAGGLK